MVAMPRSADQLTNARYVESAWKIGVRIQSNENDFVTREEVDGCIKEVMSGERKEEFHTNARKFMKMAKEAMQEGGCSDKNISEFAVKYLSS
jgi:UDP:flavonoid glycosyltransferase YjiC (YdhE family)